MGLVLLLRLGLLAPASHAWTRIASPRAPAPRTALRSEPGDGDAWGDGDSWDGDGDSWDGGGFDEAPSWEDDAVSKFLKNVEAFDASETEDDGGDAYANDALDVLASDAYAADDDAAADDGDGAEASSSSDEALDLLAAEEQDMMADAGVVVDERLGEVASHELIEVDEDGDPIVSADRMVFIDEATCIGCTMCASIAPLTFLMEDDFGRARTFNQEGDDDETVAEAISTCPVDCIHYVPWDELVSLERERDAEHYSYNFKGRLVGNEGLLSTAGAGANLLDISTNNMMRCNNCPSNKCPECPMYSVSEGKRTKRCGNCPSNGCLNCPIATQYPEFQKKRARRDRKRRERRKAEQEEIREQLGVDAPGREVDL